VAFTEWGDVELRGGAEGETSARAWPDGDREQAAFWSCEEELGAVVPPHRLIPAAARDRKSPCRTGQAAHGHFGPAGLVGDVREPATIGRNPRVALRKRFGEERLRRPSAPIGIVQTSVPPTVSTRNRPSGDQSLGSHGDFGHAIVRLTPLPSDVAKPIVGLSSVPERYATWVPSGDQTGIRS
jgi:hypothetical protein